MRQFRRKLFGCASRTRREQSIRPKISRIDLDVTELESSEVWWGPPNQWLISTQVGHGGQQFLYMGLNASQIKNANLTIGNPFEPAPGTMVLEGSYKFNITSNCAAPATKATVCDPRLRTKNTQAECGSAEDVYYWSPWRYPGNAPVIDAWCVFGCAPPRFVSL